MCGKFSNTEDDVEWIVRTANRWSHSELRYRQIRASDSCGGNTALCPELRLPDKFFTRLRSLEENCGQEIVPVTSVIA
jgi:hypothetical protein